MCGLNTLKPRRLDTIFCLFITLRFFAPLPCCLTERFFPTFRLLTGAAAAAVRRVRFLPAPVIAFRKTADLVSFSRRLNMSLAFSPGALFAKSVNKFAPDFKISRPTAWARGKRIGLIA